jgi:hypothetical protein
MILDLTAPGTEAESKFMPFIITTLYPFLTIQFPHYNSIKIISTQDEFPEVLA